MAIGRTFPESLQKALRSLEQGKLGLNCDPAEAGLDHVLVRGLDVVEGERHWPDERRQHMGALLSDHAPVEVIAE